MEQTVNGSEGVSTARAPLNVARLKAISAPRATWARSLFNTGVAVALAVLLACIALSRTLDHDEHQFVAGAALLARGGLMPYRDFAFFHTPYLLYIDATLFQFSPYLLLSARLFCAACTLAAVLCIYRIACELWRDSSSRVPLAALVLLITNPLFLATVGRARNHDPAVLMLFLAFLAARKPLAGKQSLLHALLAGVCAGLAAGIRITFVPALLAIVVSVFIFSQCDRRSRITACLAAVAGIILALAPCALIALIAPRQFWFGNFVYPFLNLRWRGLDGIFAFSTMLSKARFVIGEMLLKAPGSLAVVVLFGAALVQFLHSSGRQKPYHNEILSLSMLVAMLAVGALLPTPSFQPYFYALIPFMILAALYAAGGSSGDQAGRWSRWFGWSAIVLLPFGAYAYAVIVNATIQQRWVPIATHRAGVEIAAASGGRPILTLSPIFAVEGNAAVYPAVATGPFAFRVAPMVDEMTESLLQVMDEEDLEKYLSTNPPGLVLLGGESGLDESFLAYALRHGTPIEELSQHGIIDHKGRTSR
ncbi:hypothetical protein BH09PLA1_BH09PLA1_33820 [soil metagenome]